LYREVNRDDLGRSSHGGLQIRFFITRRHEDNYVRVKVLTEAGLKFADIEIPFSKQLEGINFVTARTIRPDGSIANFDEAVVATRRSSKTGQRGTMPRPSRSLMCRSAASSSIFTRLGSRPAGFAIHIGSSARNWMMSASSFLLAGKLAASLRHNEKVVSALTSK